MLHYPTLNLFLYDIREGFGQSEETIQQNREYFLKKLPTGTEIFEQADETEYLELLGEQRTIKFTADSPKHDGYYYPVLLNDSYGLLLNYSLDHDQDSTDLTWLENLQKLVAHKVNNQAGTLGATWFLSAHLDKLEHDLATRCCKTLFPDVEFTEKGDFLDGTLFEFKSLAEHVLIVFYPTQVALKQEPKFYSDWMSLLFYRHKITWAYGQSRKLVNKLKQGAKDIQICEQKLRESMDAEKLGNQQLQLTLNQVWQILADYATYLGELNDQTHTIEINTGNYKKRLDRLAAKGSLLQNFHILSQEKYLPQVQKDYAAFKPKLKRLENLIAYIRTSVAIQEEAREQKFQNNIATWGIGLAAGAIVASISSQFPTASANTWSATGISFLISLLAAIGFGFLTKIIISRWR